MEYGAEQSKITVNVIVLPKLLAQRLDHGGSFEASGCVVIDTLRFTTTAAHALQSGAKSIQVVQDIDRARTIANSSHSKKLLCGERLCQPIEGFDLGNSPLEYVSSVVAGRDLIFSTTNGTRAVEATNQFAECYLAGLVNRTAVAKAIHQSPIKHWQIVCAGTDNQVAGEDWLTAGAILESLRYLAPVTLQNDAAHLAWIMWQKTWDGNAVHLQTVLESFSGGRNLVQTGYSGDIEFASQVDFLTAIPARTSQSVFVRLDT